VKESKIELDPGQFSPLCPLSTASDAGAGLRGLSLRDAAGVELTASSTPKKIIKKVLAFYLVL